MKNIVLIGYMGAGKTTVGAVIASYSGLGFIDTDKYIVNRVHRSIKKIFEEDGEKTFRRMENRLCRFLQHQDNLVIATGGGVILNDDNMWRLKGNSVVVYIKNNIETLYERAKKTGTRPLARDYGEFIKRFVDREPLYEKYADIIINAEYKSVRDLAGEIVFAVLKFNETRI